MSVCARWGRLCGFCLGVLLLFVGRVFAQGEDVGAFPLILTGDLSEETQVTQAPRVHAQFFFYDPEGIAQIRINDVEQTIVPQRTVILERSFLLQEDEELEIEVIAISASGKKATRYYRLLYKPPVIVAPTIVVERELLPLPRWTDFAIGLPLLYLGLDALADIDSEEKDKKEEAQCLDDGDFSCRKPRKRNLDIGSEIAYLMLGVGIFYMGRFSWEGALHLKSRFLPASVSAEELPQEASPTPEAPPPPAVDPSPESSWHITPAPGGWRLTWDWRF